MKLNIESGCDIALTIYDAGDYGAGNDIYDLAPAGVDLSEKLIKLDMVESSEEETGLDTAASTYRFLPVNPSTQKGLMHWQ